MKMIPLRSLKILLLSLFAASLNLSATFWQVPEESIHCSYRLGHIQVLHDDDTGWSIIDNDGCPIQVEDCFVDQNIRYMENEDLIKAVGICYYDIFPFDTETGERLQTFTSYTNGYLVVGMTDTGEYTIKFFMRGPGGGKILGFALGIGLKAVGYGIICATCGPVGWGVAAAGAYSTTKSALTSWGITKGLKAFDTAAKLKNVHKAMKALAKAEEAVEKYKNAGQTAQNLKKLKDATEAVNKARSVVTQLTAVKAAGTVLNAASYVKDRADAVQSGIDAGKAGIKVAKIAGKAGATALINPMVAAVDAVGDIGQFIGELIPCI